MGQKLYRIRERHKQEIKGNTSGTDQYPWKRRETDRKWSLYIEEKESRSQKRVKMGQKVYRIREAQARNQGNSSRNRHMITETLESKRNQSGPELLEQKNESRSQNRVKIDFTSRGVARLSHQSASETALSGEWDRRWLWRRSRRFPSPRASPSRRDGMSHSPFIHIYLYSGICASLKANLKEKARANSAICDRMQNCLRSSCHDRLKYLT